MRVERKKCQKIAIEYPSDQQSVQSVNMMAHGAELGLATSAGLIVEMSGLRMDAIVPFKSRQACGAEAGPDA
jgi:hypothetical protein